MLKKIFNKKRCFEIEIIDRSGLFDYRYYGNMYPGIMQDKLVEHYLKIGDNHKRNPNQDFDKEYYIKEYPQVLAYKYHPFVHYALIGRDKNYRTKLPEAEALCTTQFYDYTPIVFEKQHQPIVSIIVPVYNSWHHNYNCLRYIFDNCKNISYEVIVADDCSTDKTQEIKKYAQNIVYIRNDKNLGFLLNCNNAAKKARGKYIFFLNSDALIQPRALYDMINVLDKNDNIGVCGAKLVLENGQIQIIGGFLQNNKLKRIGEGSVFCDTEFCNQVKELDFVTGAAFVIRRNLWKEIGGFDKRYVPAYYEDNDLCLEACRHGYSVVCNYDAIVVHLHSISYNKVRNIKKIRRASRKKFYQKWRE
ncbi:glycosyltransferase family 2 protein [Candidatus Uabimicrobium sp. HlEnr_7]|uniref:glycosyltransferase family 2 protein n=1 Tax=Candidatus Uabimicrobium helgolandensis TaxID=3095367 RepID=UPI0035579B8F